MTIAASVVFTFCLVVGVRNLVRVVGSIRWIASEARAPLPTIDESTTSFVVLVPLLREQPLVERLVKRMGALDWTGCRIVFITTAREGDGDDSTAVAVGRALEREPDPRFVHVHCDTGRDTSKADQLNFALEELGLSGSRDRSVFVGVYDADSSPDPRTLKYLGARIRRLPELAAIQQVPLYFQNLRDVRGVRGLYLMTRPLHNALFALTVEVPSMRRQPRVFASPRRSFRRVFGGWLSHGLGHGQFFRLDLVTEFGGFRPPSCDTQFGHALAFCGVPIQAHPMLDVGETPESVRVLIRQGVVWFNSMNTFWQTKRFVEERADYHRAAAWPMIVRLVHGNIAWAAYPLLFLSAFVWSLASSHWLLAAYGLAAWGVYLAPVAAILGRHDLWRELSAGFEPIRNISRVTGAGILLLFGVEKLGSCLSPFLWAVYAVRGRVRREPITLHKTERSVEA
jgi:cellulose synthase/poly-beta-1,6-N-acetylglucosamine synthase-like glycosyltransferase